MTPTAGINPQTLVAGADRALYNAKRRGRNQVAEEERFNDFFFADFIGRDDDAAAGAAQSSCCQSR
jgi:hypothetical protein